MITRKFALILALSAGFHTAPAARAVDDLLVIGLFQDKAVLLIDSTRRLLAVGERSPEGVALIAADSERAVLEIDGRQTTHKLGTRVTTTYKTPSMRRASIYKDNHGMFTTVGTINGLPVNLLVDTGASAIAMNAAQARRLGIQYRLDGEKIRVDTAAGIAPAYKVKLSTVDVGGILQRDVDAFVLDGGQPSTVLLGMSYLGRLKIQNDGHIMHLEERY